MSLLDEILNEKNSSALNVNRFEEIIHSEDSSNFKLPELSTEYLFKDSTLDETSSIYDNLFDEVIRSLTENNTSSENKINKARSRELDEKFTLNFVSLLKEEDFEFGFTTRSEQILTEQLEINALATRNWLNEIFINYFQDEMVIIGILRIIGRFNPDQIFPQGQTISIAALSHKNDEIKELGIRAFEKWGTINSLNILRSLHLETSWLQEYVNDVITDFEEQLCHY